jgi:hypothetical protein
MIRGTTAATTAVAVAIAVILTTTAQPHERQCSRCQSPSISWRESHNSIILPQNDEASLFYNTDIWTTTKKTMSSSLSRIQSQQKPKRQSLLFFGPFQAKHPWEQADYDNHVEKAQEEHPLRTNVWELDVQWFTSYRRRRQQQQQQQQQREHCPSPPRRGDDAFEQRLVVMELDSPSGYCRVMTTTTATTDSATDTGKDRNACSTRKVIAMGRWKKRPWGVTIQVRPFLQRDDDITAKSDNHNNHIMDVVDDINDEFIFFSPSFHWNPFGKYPKLSQGTIIRQTYQGNHVDDDYDEDRGKGPPWFCPVVGSFTGKGIL